MKLHPPFLTSAFVLMILALAVVAGCQNQGDAPSQDTSSAATQQVTVEVEGMSCAQGCAPIVRKTLAALPGVTNVKVDFEKKQATFSADPKLFDAKAVPKALEEAGYEGKIKS